MRVRTFQSDESGATAIEYALICAFIGLIIVGALGSVGGGLDTVLTAVAAPFS